MTTAPDHLTEEDVALARGRRLVATHLQEIEGNPLDADDVLMFEMFEREGWSHERRIAHIIERATMARFITAAE